MEKNGVGTFYAKNGREWRSWLEKNHATASSVWLIIYKKESGIPSVYYSEAVDEALCFGWIDSKANKKDESSYYQYFARRNPKSNWSGVNKQKVERLTREGRMAAAGLEMVELAKKSGTWNALDEVERLELPADMQALFNKNQEAFSYFQNFPASVKRGILEWISAAKREETRMKRIEETVKLASQNIRANQYRQPKT